MSVGNIGYNRAVVPENRQQNRAAYGWPALFGLMTVVAVGAAVVAAVNGAAGFAVAFVLLAAATLAATLVVAAMARGRATAAAAQRAGVTPAALLASTPGAWYVWALDGGEQRSPQLGALFGLADDEAGFNPVIERLDAKDAERLSEALAALRVGGTGFAMTVADAEGTRRFRAEGRLLRDGDGIATSVVLWLGDVSDLAAAVDRVRAERDRMHDILDALPVPVWRRNGDLTLAYCNKAYADIVETDRETAVAGDGVELVAEVEQAHARALAEQACDEKAPRAAAHHVVVDGARRLLNVTETPLAEGTAGIAWDATDLEDTNRDLARHIAAHTEVLERLGTAIVIYGPDKQLKFFNSAYANLWGLDEDWLRGEPFFGEVLEALRVKRRLPEVPDFPAFKRKREALFTDVIETREELLHLPNGNTLRMVTTPHPFGGILHTYEDVTDALALERSFNTLVAVQRATLDNLYEGVALFGSDGRVKLSNAGFARLWNLEPGDLEDEPHIAEVVEKTRGLYDYGDDWEAYKANVIARTTERRPRFDRLERRDDSVLEWASVPLPDGATLMTYIDVTDSVKVERALRERAEALEAADHLKTEFLANVSYELRTPLNTIIGFSEMLAGTYFGELNERQNDYVAGILDASNHLLLLINDILDLASIEAGYMQLELARFDLDAVLASMLNLTQQRIRAGDVTLEFRCPQSLGAIVGDERRIKQMVFQLLSNAIEFTPPGGKATLEARREGDGVAIAVSDTGIGIAAEDQPRVFDKFWRGREARGRRHGGGLGL
ncbi:MAG: PAS-domain containing protein, partial [Alphaproteobacteria bacterium]